MSSIYNRTRGDRNRANQELRRVEHRIEEATMLDEEIAEHSSRLMKLNKQIEMAEHQGRQAQTIKRDVEHDLNGVQFHISTAQRHREELQRSYEANRKIFLQLRDEEERFGLTSISERNQAEAAERSAEGARKELDAMLGTWVNDCVGTSVGDTSVGSSVYH